MSTLVISYSLTGNNEKLAAGIAEKLSARHIKIEEQKERKTSTTVFDMLLNRTPEIRMDIDDNEKYDQVLFVAPVWIGSVASPMRGCIRKMKQNIERYAFISISGGADGPNPKLENELMKRTGKKPEAVIDLHIADLLPPEPKPQRKDTSVYKINENDIEMLKDKVIRRLNESNIL